MSDEGWRGNTHGQFSIPYTRVWTKNTETESEVEFPKLMGELCEKNPYKGTLC